MNTLTISESHRKLLTDSAVPLATAETAGVFTASVAADLPDELSHLADLLPAMIFRHESPTGIVRFQSRPDNPAEGAGKYMQAPGSGSLLSVHPDQRIKLGLAKKLMIVEGTKQALAAAAWAPGDTLVVGIQGCNGFMSSGVPSPELEFVLGDNTEVFIFFDADVATNRNVHDAAAMLVDHMELLGAASVKCVSLPVSGKAGLDDYLAGIGEAKRTEVIENLMTKAKKLGRAPAAAKPKMGDKSGTRTSIAPTVDFENAQIRLERGTGDDAFSVPLAQYACRIVETTTIEDDLNDPKGVTKSITHRLQIVTEPGGTIYEVDDVANSDLKNPTVWLTRMPGSIGSRLDQESGNQANEKIEAAIRRHAGETGVIASRGIRRLGPIEIDGVWGFLHAGGIITADGNSDAARSVLDAPYDKVNYPDPAMMDRACREEAVASLLGLLEQVRDHTALVLLLGHDTQGSTGSHIEGVVGLSGGHGFGKTTQARGVASMLSPYFADNSMIAGTPSPGVVLAAGEHLHHSMVIVDDVARESDDDAGDLKVFQALDAFARRAHSGGADGRPRLEKNAEGKYAPAAAELSHPIGVVIGEILTKNTKSNSGAERFITARVDKNGSFIDDAALDRFLDIGRSGGPNQAKALILQWMATQATAVGYQEWHKALDAQISAAKESLAIHPELSARSRRVAAGVLVGWKLLTTALSEIAPGVVPEKRRVELLQHGQELITAAILQHTAVALAGTETPHENLLDHLRSLIASAPDSWTILEPGQKEPVERQKAIGKRMTVLHGKDYIEVVALLPAVIADALRERNSAAVTRRLSAVALKDSRGKSSRSVKFNGIAVTAICIPLSIWNGDVTEILTASQAADSQEPLAPGNQDGSSPAAHKPATITSIHELPVVDA
jgi:hypothetical protein